MAMKSKGYTLTEAMLVVAIVGTLAAVTAPLLVQMTNFWRLTGARTAIQRDVRSNLDTINRFLRQAQASTVVIDQITNQPPFSRITYRSIQGQSVCFYQNGNQLFMTLDGKNSILSSNIAYIAFTYPRTDDTSIIAVAITAQAATYLGGNKALQLSIQKVRVMN